MNTKFYKSKKNHLKVEAIDINDAIKFFCDSSDHNKSDIKEITEEEASKGFVLLTDSVKK